MTEANNDWKLMTIARSGAASVFWFSTKAEADRAADAARGIDRSAPSIKIKGWDRTMQCLAAEGPDGETVYLQPPLRAPWDIVETRVFQ